MSDILDCTVVSNFAAAGAMDVLRLALTSPFISTQVYEEIYAGLAAGYEFYRDMNQLIFPFNAGGWCA